MTRPECQRWGCGKRAQWSTIIVTGEQKKFCDKHKAQSIELGLSRVAVPFLGIRR